jgi:DNA-binding transcriptional LysR family regulator
MRQLEYLASLARERHFGRAAKACFVSQPALSSGIRRLEAELGVTIVQRGQRFQGFTHEGRTVVSWANRILAERDALRGDLDRIRGGLRTTLRIGVIPSAVPVSPMITHQFSMGHPDARVRVEGMEAPEITRRLAGYEIDAGITYLEASTTPTLRTLELYREHYVLLVSLDHPLATQEEVTWGDAATLDLCTMTQRMHNRQILDSAAARDGVKLRPAVETDDAGAMYAHVVGRKMSSIVSQAWLHSFKIPAGMCARRLATAAPEAIGVVALEQHPPSAITSALWHSLADIDIAAELDSVASALVTG